MFFTGRTQGSHPVVLFKMLQKPGYLQSLEHFGLIEAFKGLNINAQITQFHV